VVGLRGGKRGNHERGEGRGKTRKIFFVCHVGTCLHDIPYHTIPYHTIPYHTIPYHTIPYHTIA